MTDISSTIDIVYGSATAHKLDLYWPTSLRGDQESSKGRPLVCFVHGGAWRSEDKSDYAELAIRLAKVTGCPIVIPNYRLTPPSPTPETQLQHPAHAEDILASLEFLIGPSSPVFNLYPKNASLDLYLIGHSCSAHILTSIFLDSSPVTPTLTPSPTLLSYVKAIAMSEGIYDIDLLVKHFPTYERGSVGFVVNTFGDRSDSPSPGKAYTDVSITSYPSRQDGRHLKWMIVHSVGDSLVDIPQSQAAFDHLISDFPEVIVKKDFETISMDHNAMLATKEYSDLVGGYILGLIQ